MPNPEITDLSERELEILKLVATGASNKEIAQKLFISSNTVKVHLRNIFNKIGVTSRTEAAMYAVRTGLVVHPPSQPIQEDSENETAGGNSVVPVDSIAIESSQPSSRRISRWAPIFLVAGLLGIIALGVRLSPSLAIFTIATSTPPPPVITPTPLPHWNHLASLPSGRSDSAIVSYSDQIFVIGGLNPDGIYGGMVKYDLQTDSWSALPAKPTPVYDAQAAVINGLIFVPGGRTSLAENLPTDIMEVYDTNTGEWYTGTPLPVPLSAYGMVAYDGDLFIFGGWDGLKYRDSVYVYDPALDIWEARSPMPTARGYCGVVEAGGRIYVIGGINEVQSVDVNEIYSPARDNSSNNPWTSGFPIPENRTRIEAANIADTIYVFGGEEQNNNRVGLIYFPQTNIWQSLETSPFSLGTDFSMTSIGTNLFFIGGLFGSEYSDQNITYQAIITLSIPIIIR